MRVAMFASVVALTVLATEAAHATQVTWRLDGEITNSRTLGNFGSPEVGSSIHARMVVETDTPATGQEHGSFYNLFRSFELSIGTSILTLGPDSSEPAIAYMANGLIATDFGSNLLITINTLLYEGSSAYQARFRFSFTDLNAFPYRALPNVPPSLSSATLREFEIYSPVEHGLIFLARGSISSFLAAESVPEPSSIVLFLSSVLILGGFIRGRTHRRVIATLAG